MLSSPLYLSGYKPLTSNIPVRMSGSFANTNSNAAFGPFIPAAPTGLGSSNGSHLGIGHGFPPHFTRPFARPGKSPWEDPST